MGVRWYHMQRKSLHRRPAVTTGIVAIVITAPSLGNTVQSINADSLTTSFAPLSGQYLIEENHVGVNVKRPGDTVALFPDAHFSLSSVLVTDTSAAGLASGSFVNGQLRITDNGSLTDLLTGDLVALQLQEVEVVFGQLVLSRYLVANSSFRLTGGTLAGDMGGIRNQHSIVALTFNLSTNPADFQATAFSGTAKVTILPEPSIIGVLAIVTLLMWRHARRRR